MGKNFLTRSGRARFPDQATFTPLVAAGSFGFACMSASNVEAIRNSEQPY